MGARLVVVMVGFKGAAGVAPVFADLGFRGKAVVRFGVGASVDVAASGFNDSYNMGIGIVRVRFNSNSDARH